MQDTYAVDTLPHGHSAVPALAVLQLQAFLALGSREPLWGGEGQSWCPGDLVLASLQPEAAG